MPPTKPPRNETPPVGSAVRVAMRGLPLTGGKLFGRDELREASKEYKGHGLALTLLGSYLADVAEGDVRRRKEIGPLEEDEREGGHARRVMAVYEPWLGEVEVAILRMIGLFDRPATEAEIGALRKEPVIAGLGVDHAWSIFERRHAPDPRPGLKRMDQERTECRGRHPARE